MSRYIDIEPYEKDGWYLQKHYHNSYGEVIKTTPLISVPTEDVEPKDCKKCKSHMAFQMAKMAYDDRRAEPIVWCKDCKYKVGENTEYDDAHCEIHERGNNRELTVGDYDYCSWGEVEDDN